MWGFLGKFFSLLKKAFKTAVDAGLTDDVMDLALRWVKVAADMTIEKAEKREWVVQMLKSKGFPESIARLAVELAYQLFKKELAKLDEI